jgi:hypothetical protein
MITGPITQDFKPIDELMALRFTATGARPTREAHADFVSDSACLMADNIWNEGKQLTCRPLNSIMYMTCSVVHAWEFVYEWSAIGSSYRRHEPFVPS